MMKTVMYAFLAFMLLSSSTCKKEKQELNFERKLIGKWQYTGRSGGFAGKYEKADPVELTVIEFKSGKNFIRSVNHKVAEEGKFELYRINSIYSKEDDNAIRFKSKTINSDIDQVITITNDTTLSISQNVYDGFSFGYKKI